MPLPDAWKARLRGPLGLRLLVAGCLLVLVAAPAAVLVRDALRGGWDNFRAALTLPAAVAAMGFTLRTAAAAAALNAVMGVVIAWVLARHVFPGRRVLDALLDLPLAVPGLAAGAALAVLYGPRAEGGLRALFSAPGFFPALLFVTLPPAVRAVQPLLEADQDQEDAASSLGAPPWQAFRRVVLPRVLPGVLSGALLSFARGLGELGAVVMVAGNVPFKTQAAAVYVLGEVEAGNRLGAGAVSVAMMAASFLAVLAVEGARDLWMRRRP